MADNTAQNIVAMYPDRAAAQHAADELVASGVPATRLHVHERAAAPRNAAGIKVDEYATGGFFANFAKLLSGLLDAKVPVGTATSYDELVQFEGAALTVDDVGSDQALSIEKRLLAGGATKVARSAD
jgi:hypothetical protein